MEIKTEQRTAIITRQLDQLCMEQAQHEINIIRWRAIPNELCDGTEALGIENAERAIKVINAQIDALESILK